MSLQKILGRVIYYLCKILSKTVRFSSDEIKFNKNSIISVWHQDIIVICIWALKFKKNINDFTVVISRHRDADLALETLKKLKINVLRGSSTRGYVSVVKQILNLDTPLIIISDGPKGPPRIVKKGVINLAKKTFREIFHVEFHGKGTVTLPTWDRLKIPLPLSYHSVVIKCLSNACV